jgi:hypothetical protein
MAQPEHAVERDPAEIADHRQPLPADDRKRSKHHAAHQEPPERERLGRQKAAGGTDPDECRRPQDDGDKPGGKRKPFTPRKLNFALHPH